MELLISVVIPTYRRPQLLHNCLKALQQQVLPAAQFEVIVVSDGPDDLTRVAVEREQRPGVAVRYLPLLEKGGPAAARNHGWKQAKSPLIAFTDDDCLPAPGWLSAIVRTCQHAPLAAYSGRIKVPLPAHPTDFERNTQGLEQAAFVTANCACTKAALEQVGGFDESFTMAWREDSDLEFKLLLHGIPVQKLADALVVHPVRQAPWGVSLKEQKKGMFNALLYKKYPRLYRERIQQQPAFGYYIMIFCTLAAITGLLVRIPWISGVAAGLWLLLMVQFIARRLATTSRAVGHVLEMIITSLAIPFLSVYWQLYGAYKYRVLFL